MKDFATSTHWAGPEIKRFRRLDAETDAESIKRPTVVFVGSSIFREWREARDFDEDWRGRMGDATRALNRAFGGAETTDLLTFFDDVVPRRCADVRAIVYYCGSNDVSVGRSAREVFENFKRFAESARRERSAKLGVVFVGIIDSPQKRAFALSHVVRETNALCEAWCAKTPGAVYADVTETFADVSRVSRRRDAFATGGVRGLSRRHREGGRRSRGARVAAAGRKRRISPTHDAAIATRARSSKSVV